MEAGLKHTDENAWLRDHVVDIDTSIKYVDIYQKNRHVAFSQEVRLVKRESRN